MIANLIPVAFALLLDPRPRPVAVRRADRRRTMTPQDIAASRFRLADRARKAVLDRKWTDRPGGAWHLDEVGTPRYCGVFTKAYVYVSKDGQAYDVIIFSYSNEDEVARRSYRGLDAAFRNGQAMADAPVGGDQP